MNYVLFVASMPNLRGGNPNHVAAWTSYSGIVDQQTEKAKGVSRLGPNVWLLNLREAVSAFATMVSTTESHGIAFRLLPFDDEPRWIQGNPEQNTNQ